MRTREELEAVAADLRGQKASGQPLTAACEAQRLIAGGFSVVESMFVLVKAFDISLGDAKLTVLTNDRSGALMAEHAAFLAVVDADPRFRST
ncbi:hypothetical protein [Oerskovia turbata]